jgi:hypothetical protein
VNEGHRVFLSRSPVAEVHSEWPGIRMNDRCPSLYCGIHR